MTVVRETSLPGLPVRRGKVRDIYDLGDRLLLVSTDRISAFDWVLPTAIPDKGRVLTQIAAFWFRLLGEPNHLITTDVEEMDLPPGADRRMLAGRSTLCRKTEVVPIECVVRGYLAGSGWKEYQQQRHRLRHQAAGRPDRKQPLGRADFHPRDQGRHRPRRKYLVRANGRPRGTRFGRAVARAVAADLCPRLRARSAAGHSHRRHKVRIRPGGGRSPLDR